MRARALWSGVAATVLCVSPAAAAGKPPRGQLSGVLNLNDATLQQLDVLPGVGPKAAREIIAYREKQRFTRIEDLVRVRGFGKKRYDKLKAHLTNTGRTTLQRHRGKVVHLARND
jgi:competence protein ComEA